MSIGYVGLGNMGGQLARRLLLQIPLQVYDLNLQSVQALVSAGATACDRLADLAAKCDTILICLPTSDHVRKVIFGEGGIAASAKPGTQIIDQTTGDPQATRKMAAELAERGLELLDAPVSGGPMGAKAGTIAIMVGGTDEQFERVRHTLSIISPNVFHAGDVGSGHVIKLANNMLSATQRIVTQEAMALAVKNGLSPQKAYEIIMASSGRNFFLETFVGSHIITGKLTCGFTLGLIHKDLKLSCEMGANSGVPMFFGNLARDFYQMCISEMGYDTEVNSSALVMDRITGSHVVPENHDLK